jgi:YggT family protein
VGRSGAICTQVSAQAGPFAVLRVSLGGVTDESGASSGTVDAVETARTVLYYVLFFFWLLLTARVVVELVRAFAREWRPAGGVAVTLETIYTVTDPPVRLVRRVIPMVRIGGVGLDVSIMVLLLVVFILMRLAYPG